MSEIRKIAIMTSGGDAPGMNACVRAIVRSAGRHRLLIDGIMRGYEGMINGDFEPMSSRSVANIIHRGGTVLKTARSAEFRTKEGRQQAYEQLKVNHVDAVVAIGGDGTFTGADIFSQEFNIPFIGIPGTIDNDLYGTDYTIGFDTAVNTAIEAVDKIRDTADSHDRLFFIEVMGRDSGYIALYTGIGVGAGTIMLPETDTDYDELVDILKAGVKRKKLFNLIIVAEGNKNGGAYKIAEEVQKRYDHYETKVAVIGHLQRGGSPTAADRLLSSRLGYAAVNALLNDERNVMVGVINQKIVYTPLNEAITKGKKLDPELVKMSEILAT